MVIDQVYQACGYVAEGEFVAFDSPGCLLRSYETVRKEGRNLPVGIYFADYQDGSLNPAESVTFLLTEHLPTVMNSGVLCFRGLEAAKAASLHDHDVSGAWVGYGSCER